jgi:hypothetical protein
MDGSRRHFEPVCRLAGEARNLISSLKPWSFRTCLSAEQAAEGRKLPTCLLWISNKNYIMPKKVLLFLAQGFEA